MLEKPVKGIDVLPILLDNKTLETECIGIVGNDRNAAARFSSVECVVHQMRSDRSGAVHLHFTRDSGIHRAAHHLRRNGRTGHDGLVHRKSILQRG